MKSVTLIAVLLLAGCASGYNPSSVQAENSVNCPFGTVEWADKDGVKCVRKFQMEKAIGW